MLVGECKWSKIENPNRLLEKLKYNDSLMPGIKGKKIIPVLFVKELKSKADRSANIFTPEDVLARLK